MASAAAALAAGLLRINHYKPGKQLLNAVRDSSLKPLGPAVSMEISSAFGDQTAVVVRFYIYT